MLVGSGWNRLPCGVAVLADEDGKPVMVCDLGVVTLDVDEGIFAGDESFVDMLTDELRAEGWDVALGLWEPASEEQRSVLALELDDDDLVERAAHVAEVVGPESNGPDTPPRRAVPGMPGVEVDRYGTAVVQRLTDDHVKELPLRESGGMQEVDIDGETWCVDELVRRAWDDDETGRAQDEGRQWS